jgi:hypothetical protein
MIMRAFYSLPNHVPVILARRSARMIFTTAWLDAQFAARRA